MKIYLIPLIMILFSGCADPEELKRLNLLVNQLRRENAEMRQNLPSEQPKVAKQLEESEAKRARLLEEVKGLERELAQAKNDLTPELQPLSQTIIQIERRLKVLEETTSRKGHYHTYSQKDSLFDYDTSKDQY